MVLNNRRSVWPTCSTRLPNGQMLNRWLNEKNNLSVVQLRFRGAKKVKKCCMFCILQLIFLVLGRESKIGECHATSYVSLPLWCKKAVREFSPFFMMYSKVIYTDLTKTEIGNCNSDGYFHQACAICQKSSWKNLVEHQIIKNDKKI